MRGLRIPERTLTLLRDLIASQAGIHYDDDRLDLLRDRLVPLAIERGFDSLLDYYYLLKYDADAATEWPRVMDALSVQETYFWREADHFRALATVDHSAPDRAAAADHPDLVDPVRLGRGAAVDRDGAERGRRVSPRRTSRSMPATPAKRRWPRRAPAATAAARSASCPTT